MYQETKWPYYGYRSLIRKFGSNCLDDLKELKKNGLIDTRGGLNGPLIELIDLKKWENQAMTKENIMAELVKEYKSVPCKMCGYGYDVLVINVEDKYFMQHCKCGTWYPNEMVSESVKKIIESNN